MANFTMGPWSAAADELVPERGAVYVEGPAGWDDEAICDCGYSSDVEVDEANARLIAAAPDMLTALEQAGIIVAEHCNGQHPDNECWSILRTVSAAIAKAVA